MILEEEYLRRFIVAVAESEKEHVKQFIPSKTLRDALEIIYSPNFTGFRLNIPYYWSVWYHDGRGPVRPQTAQRIVYFADPRNDPRLAGGYPKRPEDARRLTKAEYEHGLEMNRRVWPDVYMWVVDSTGPFKPGYQYFKKLEQGASERASLISTRLLEQYSQDLFKELGFPKSRDITL